MQMFLEKFNLKWKPFEVARRVTVQMINDLPLSKRSGFKIGDGEEFICNEIIEEFYTDKTLYENYEENRLHKKSGEVYYNRMPFYILPKNNGELIKLNIHISEDQIKRYYAGGTQIPILVLYSFCKIIGTCLDVFMACVNEENVKWDELTQSDLIDLKLDNANKSMTNLTKHGFTAIISPEEMDERVNLELSTAKSACFIYHILHEFITDRIDMFVKKINEGCDYKFLLCCDENSLFAKEVSLINKGDPNIKAARIVPALETFKMIKNKLINPDTAGSLEVRSYSTEKRNSAAIFFGKGYVRAFLVVLIPPKSASQCIALEYNGAECADVVDYFNAIWERHETDVYV